MPQPRASTSLAAAPHVEQLLGGGDLDAAFAAIYRIYSKRIFGFFRRKGVDVEDAHDLVATAFLRLWKAVDRIEDPRRFDAYLWTIARNVFRRWLEDRGRRPVEVGVDDDFLNAVHMDDPALPIRPPWGAPDAEHARREARRAVERTIDELPTRMRQCVSLRLLQGLRNREIAEALGISASAVGFNLSEGRRRVARELTRQGFADALRECA